MAQNFSWAAGQDVVLGGLKGLIGWYNNKASSDAQRIAAEGQRKANNIVAHGKNTLAAAMRGINNERIMRAAGAAYNAQTTNMARHQANSASRRFESAIARSEQEGAMASQLAASGVGGSALQMMEVSHNLQQARLEYQADQQEGQITYNIAQQMAGIMPSALGSLEQGSMGGNMDFVQSSSSRGGGAFSALAAFAVGAMNQKESMQVMLDSLTPSKGGGIFNQPTLPTITDPYKVTSTPVRSNPVVPIDLQSFSTAPTQSTLGSL